MPMQRHYTSVRQRVLNPSKYGRAEPDPLCDNRIRMKKFKDKHFAAQVDRTLICTCEATLNTPLPEFVGLTLTAMKKYGAIIEGMKKA